MHRQNVWRARGRSLRACKQRRLQRAATVEQPSPYTINTRISIRNPSTIPSYTVLAFNRKYLSHGVSSITTYQN